LRPVMKAGARIAPPEPLAAMRERCKAALAKLHPGILRLANPHAYPAGLELRLNQHRNQIIEHLH
jgi:nicotinate phosphoribosyltransferase